MDVSFVKTKLFDVYDELVEAPTLSAVVRILNRAFAKYDITFISNDRSYTGLHDMSYKSVGIVEGETFPDGKINIHLWSEVVFVLAEDKTFNRFISLLSSVIRHELVHREQTARSATKCHQQELKRCYQGLSEWQQYYNDRHEQGAMAHEIIENLLQARLNNQTILTQLRLTYSPLFAKHSMRYSEIHEDYMEDVRVAVMKRIKKVMYQIIQP